MRKTNEDDYEVGLSAFKGTCYKCQKFGHKVSDCKMKIKFKGNCNNCGKQGHKAVDCWEKEENKDKCPKGFKPQREKVAAATDSRDTDSRVKFLLYGSPELSFPDVQELLDDPNVWIGDTAATVDMTPYKEGMTNLRTASKDDGIAMGNGQIVKTIEIGEIRGTICDKHGNKLNRVRMTEVQYLPKMKYNLFSLMKRMNGRWKLIGESEKIRLKKGNQEVTFDIKIPTPKGAVYAMYLSQENEIGGSAMEVGTKMMIQQVHEHLGHCGEEATCKTAKELGWTLTSGTLNPCEACATGKAKQKNVPKESESKPAKKGENRIYLDIATVKKRKGQPRVNRLNWHIMVDEWTQLKFSDFYTTKNGMVEPTCEQFYRWKQSGNPVKYVRLDNAGENKLLKKRCQSKDWKLKIEFEFTARDTPQQNSLAEVGFATIANRGRALMYQANIPYSV